MDRARKPSFCRAVVALLLTLGQGARQAQVGAIDGRDVFELARQGQWHIGDELAMPRAHRRRKPQELSGQQRRKLDRYHKERLPDHPDQNKNERVMFKMTRGEIRQFLETTKIIFVRDLAPSSRANSDRPLKFIHITKTGGSFIEEHGKKEGLRWGKYHAEYTWDHSGYVKTKYHAPFIEAPPKIAMKYDWFMVVRNPYDRLISEFHCRFGGVGAVGTEMVSQLYDKDAFNHELNHSIMHHRTKLFNCCQKSGHYIPQFKYLQPQTKIWVIKFENLTEEFNMLMDYYRLTHLKLPPKTEKKNTNQKVFGIDALSTEMVHQIQMHYHNDFALFGYDFHPPKPE